MVTRNVADCASAGAVRRRIELSIVSRRPFAFAMSSGVHGVICCGGAGVCACCGCFGAPGFFFCCASSRCCLRSSCFCSRCCCCCGFGCRCCCCGKNCPGGPPCDCTSFC